MAAAREQAQERRLDRFGPEEEGCHMAVEVVDGRQRQAARPGEGLRRGDADEERADEPGPCVTAIVSTSSSVAPASPSASRTTGTTSSRCRREATSGTTPP